MCVTVMKRGTDIEGQWKSLCHQTPRNVAALERLVVVDVAQTGAVDRNYDLQDDCI